MNLEFLCGEHYLSGVELTSEDVVQHGWGQQGWIEKHNIILFTLDDVTYKMMEDPCDGYRSTCSDIFISEKPPKYRFEPVKVLGHMKEDGYYTNEIIVFRDCKNGKIVLEAGTENVHDYYPCCIFHYMPENMACNAGR